MKLINITCHVERLRDSSGTYPRFSRLESADGWPPCPCASAITASAMIGYPGGKPGYSCRAMGIRGKQRERERRMRTNRDGYR